MRILLTSLLAISLSACSSSLPQFPDIKYQYSIFIKDGSVYCFKYEILSWNPYKLKPIDQDIDLLECQNMGGFSPADIQKLLNYVKESTAWAEAHKKCFAK